MSADETILAEQRDYYDHRADEYDEWFYRRGRYFRGDEATRTWFEEVEQVRSSFLDVPWRNARVLEMAPGTGIWSEWLIDQGAVLSVVDASSAMLGHLRARLGERVNDVNIEVADLFSWSPPSTFDAVFFGFFVSHVPLVQLTQFFDVVASALRPGGHVAFIDSRRDATSTAVDHVLPSVHDEVMIRRLNDGREFQIVKNFYSPQELSSAALSAGLNIHVQQSANYFVFGTGTRT